MNKIQKGDYVRISDCRCKTKIARIEKILDKDPCYKNMQMYRIDTLTYQPFCYCDFEIYKEDIIKHSSNIIDLIEVGDIVNGYKVLEIRRNNNRILIGVYKDTETVIYQSLANENVKRIVTKEQFKGMEYRV